MALTLLAGCSSPPEDNASHPSGWITFIDTDKNFSLSYPPEAKFRFDRSDGSVAFATTRGATSRDKPHDYYFSIQELSESCSPSITGASYAIAVPNRNDKTIWGKVDAFDAPNPDFEFDQPLCRPPILKWEHDEQSGITRLSNDAAYVLCSEHNDKVVLICISQVTNNLKLAEEIFQTFRWTDK